MIAAFTSLTVTPQLPRVLVADPPWLFGDKLPGATRGAERNYRCLTVAEIKAFPLPALSTNVLLFLWRVSAMQEEALAVARAWGFVPKSEIVWEKLTKTGKPWIGMGHYTRANHETCLIAVRGKPTILDHGVRSRFAAHVPCGTDGSHIHSAKPPEFRQLVERLCAGPYVELFARDRWPGWTQYGDELCNATYTISK